MRERTMRERIPTHLYDGYQVHRAALARGLQVLALPRQVLLAGKDRTVPSQVSFAHGVPESSTVSAVTYAQDRRLRRALLERAGVPVPRGATFTWNGIGPASRWAEAHGYPVVIKETVGENPGRTIRDVRSREDITAAFQELRRREPLDRAPGSNPLMAGWAPTRLGYILDDDGNEVAPLRTRFLLERQTPGETVRALVVGGRVIAAVLLDAEGTGTEEVTASLHEGLGQVLVRAAEAIPGLAMATVDAVVDDHRRSAAGQSCVIVELSERPRIETYITADEALGDRIGDALLAGQAAQAQVELPDEVTSIQADLLIQGLRDVEAVRAALPDAAAPHGLELTVTDTDPVAGELRARCAGTPRAVALSMELLLAGHLVSDRAASVEYTIRSDDE